MKLASGFLPLLTIAFIVLKLCGVITWSWWLVLLPIIAPIAMFCLCVAVLAICGSLGAKD